MVQSLGSTYFLVNSTAPAQWLIRSIFQRPGKKPNPFFSEIEELFWISNYERGIFCFITDKFVSPFQYRYFKVDKTGPGKHLIYDQSMPINRQSMPSKHENELIRNLQEAFIIPENEKSPRITTTRPPPLTTEWCRDTRSLKSRGLTVLILLLAILILTQVIMLGFIYRKRRGARSVQSSLEGGQAGKVKNVSKEKVKSTSKEKVKSPSKEQLKSTRSPSKEKTGSPSNLKGVKGQQTHRFTARQS